MESITTLKEKGQEQVSMLASRPDYYFNWEKSHFLKSFINVDNYLNYFFYFLFHLSTKTTDYYNFLLFLPFFFKNFCCFKDLKLIFALY
jgi:hypothetical protein